MTSLKAKKSLGQNFLMHARTAERIVAAAGVTREDVVVEVGPGTGALTRELLKCAKKVIAIEADDRLIPVLEETFANELALKTLELIHADIREIDTTRFPKGYSLVANIPYYITGELFRFFLTASNQPQAMTLLVQKEVAERIARSKKESLLSLSIKVYGTPAYAFTVPKGAFVPAPKVDSAVLTIRDISRKHFNSPEEEQRFFELIRAGFAHKRKLLANNLREVGFTNLSLPPKVRAEDLPLATWLALTGETSK
jgi:16S rRNA (adenine1518-N6/adenine1519-N6)-dimethyltransferase